MLLGMPLALPSYVAAFGWIGWQPGLAGRTGAAVVLITISYPYVYLPVLAALHRCDPALEDVSRSLGRGPLATFWRVTVPQVRVAATGGGLLVGLYVLSDFGAVATMRHEVLTTAIYGSYRGSFDRTPAAVLGCVLALLALLVVAAERATRRGTRTAKVGSGTVRPQPIVSRGSPALASPRPPGGLAGAGARRARPRPAPVVHRGHLTTAPASWRPPSTRCRWAPSGRWPWWWWPSPWPCSRCATPVAWPRLATSAAYAGHALPGVVVGLSLVFFGISYAQAIYQELPLLVVAYVVLYLSLALASLQNAIAQIPPALDDVSRSLGRTAWGTWRAVTARLAAPGVGAAATLVFLTIMKELPATLFLRPTGFDTLATQLWSHTSGFSKAAAAPYALAIVVLAALPTALLTVAVNGSGRPRRSTDAPAPEEAGP